MVSYSTEELVWQGHDLTLLAGGDSVTAAELAPCERPLRLDPDDRDRLADHMIMLDEVLRRAEELMSRI